MKDLGPGARVTLFGGARSVRRVNVRQMLA